MGKNFVCLYETRTRSARARASRARAPQITKQHILQCVARHLNGERRAIASFSLLLPPFSQDDKISLLLPPIGSKCAWPHQTLGSPYQPQLGQSGTSGTPSASLSVALRPQIVCPRLFSHGEKGLPRQVGRFIRPCTRSTASPGVSGHTRGTQAVATDT